MFILNISDLSIVQNVWSCCIMPRSRYQRGMANLGINTLEIIAERLHRAASFYRSSPVNGCAEAAKGSICCAPALLSCCLAMISALSLEPTSEASSASELFSKYLSSPPALSIHLHMTNQCYVLQPVAFFIVWLPCCMPCDYLSACVVTFSCTLRCKVSLYSFVF